jgi:hypothetical protein
MSALRSLVHGAVPWIGLIVGLLSLIIVHQFGSEGTFDDCRHLAPGPVLVVALLGLLACVASGLVSWRGTRGSDESARRLVGIISFACSIFFAFAIVLAIFAILLLPPCFG